jgi:hypothetical protein
LRTGAADADREFAGKVGAFGLGLTGLECTTTLLSPTASTERTFGASGFTAGRTVTISDASLSSPSRIGVTATLSFSARGVSGFISISKSVGPEKLVRVDMCASNSCLESSIENRSGVRGVPFT